MKSWRNETQSDHRRNLYAGLLLVLAVAVVYSPVIGFEFLIYDDPNNVYENPLINNFTWTSLQRFWSGTYEKLYVPLTYTVWGLLARTSVLFGSSPDGALNPAFFHAANLLIHLASVLVFFRILQRLFGNQWAAGAGALLFALHPVQVEAVAWVTGLKDVLYGFFAILALDFYLLYATSPVGTARRAAMRRYGLATLFFVLALLAKPSAVMLPLLVGVIGFFCLERAPRLLCRELLPWLVLTIPLIILTKSAQPGSPITLGFTLGQRVLVAGDSLSFYLAKLLWPATLAPDYGRTPALVLGSGWAYATLLPPLALAVLLFWKCRAPWLRAGALVFCLAPLPVLGLVPFDFQRISTVADRYLYLAMLGPGCILAWLLNRWQNKWSMLVIFSGLALLALESRMALANWHDSFSFNSHALQVNPRSSTTINNLGVAYQEAGNFRDALATYRRAMEIAPDSPDAFVNTGNLYSKAGMPREAIPFYEKALNLQPQSLGLVYLKIGEAYENLGEHEQALTNYHQALYCYGVVGAGGFELARVHVAIGLLYKGTGRIAEAIEAYRQALREKPDFAEAYSNLGVIYGEQGRGAEAEECYRRAVAISPTLAEPYNNLGLIYLDRHREQEALAMFRKAAGLAPRQPVPINNLGRAYLALGQYEPALSAFQQALKINAAFAPALAGMAQAYRRMGREDLADAYTTKARALGYAEPLAASGGTPRAQPQLERP